MWEDAAEQDDELFDPFASVHRNKNPAGGRSARPGSALNIGCVITTPRRGRPTTAPGAAHSSPSPEAALANSPLARQTNNRSVLIGQLQSRNRHSHDQNSSPPSSVEQANRSRGNAERSLLSLVSHDFDDNGRRRQPSRERSAISTREQQQRHSYYDGGTNYPPGQRPLSAEVSPRANSRLYKFATTTTSTRKRQSGKFLGSGDRNGVEGNRPNDADQGEDGDERNDEAIPSASATSVRRGLSPKQDPHSNASVCLRIMEREGSAAGSAIGEWRDINNVNIEYLQQQQQQQTPSPSTTNEVHQCRSRLVVPNAADLRVPQQRPATAATKSASSSSRHDQHRYDHHHGHVTLSPSNKSEHTRQIILTQQQDQQKNRQQVDSAILHSEVKSHGLQLPLSLDSDQVFTREQKQVRSLDIAPRIAGIEKKGSLREQLIATAPVKGGGKFPSTLLNEFVAKK